MPIVNTLAFLFTVLGDWYVDGKVISKGEFVFVHSYLCIDHLRYCGWNGSYVGWNWVVCSEQALID